MKHPNICIIGAGPVGLWTAAQLKARLPDSDIIVLDKRVEYTRDNVLNIDAASFSGAARSPGLAAMIGRFRQQSTLRTKEIQERLAELAAELGVRVLGGQQYTVRGLDEIPSADLVICADGYSGPMRSLLHGAEGLPEFSHQEVLQYIVDVRVLAERPSTMPARGGVRASKMGAKEAVRAQRSESGSATVRCFVSKETFDHVDGDLARNGTLDALPEELKTKAEKHLNRTVGKGNWQREGVTVAKVRLQRYRATQFTFDREGQQYVLVGDAAFGVPYFRSLNNGLLCGTKLAKVVADTFKPGGSQDLTDYTRYIESLVASEMRWARVKQMCLTSLFGSLRLLSFNGLVVKMNDYIQGDGSSTWEPKTSKYALPPAKL